ncbi:hypothetical protein F8388_018511 [Cannabis sativa]|uniref:Uncharacterized protein n=1 Tax=Cannabis sativa TaxID=3483 RepID=A0A7J6G743_CANSA|nr:hypothetical protein F8388_018511 [Cannabis sativa]
MVDEAGSLKSMKPRIHIQSGDIKSGAFKFEKYLPLVLSKCDVPPRPIPGTNPPQESQIHMPNFDAFTFQDLRTPNIFKFLRLSCKSNQSDEFR